MKNKPIEWDQERVRSLRESACLTVQEASVEAGVSLSAWSSWEHGRRSPTSYKAVSALERMWRRYKK